MACPPRALKAPSAATKHRRQLSLTPQSERVTSFESIKLHNLVFKKFLSKLNPCRHCTSAGQLGQGITEKAGPAAPRAPEPSSEQGPRAPPPAGHHACLFSSFLDKPPSKWGAGRGRGPSG